jgi:hypothetical protein
LDGPEENPQGLSPVEALSQGRTGRLYSARIMPAAFSSKSSRLCGATASIHNSATKSQEAARFAGIFRFYTSFTFSFKSNNSPGLLMAQESFSIP